MVDRFYRCNPELNKECRKTACQKECTLTTHKEYARTDEFGKPIIVDEFEKIVTLKEIREEIDQLETTKCTETHSINISAQELKEKVLDIIDRYLNWGEEWGKE